VVKSLLDFSENTLEDMIGECMKDIAKSDMVSKDNKQKNHEVMEL